MAQNSIGTMINALLVTEMPYLEIERRVRDAFAHSRTTVRSIASMAVYLREKGIEVPDRRKLSRLPLQGSFDLQMPAIELQLSLGL